MREKPIPLVGAGLEGLVGTQVVDEDLAHGDQRRICCHQDQCNLCHFHDLVVDGLVDPGGDLNGIFVGSSRELRLVH